MMKKCIAWLLALLLIPSIVGATTWFGCNGDTFCGSGTASYWGTVDLAPGQSSPSGSTNVWRWTFKDGTPGGEGIGNVWPASSMGTADEMWIQWYWKYSPGFQWHSVGNKQMYFYPSNTIGMLFMGSNITMTPQGPNNRNYDPNVGPTPWYHDTGAWHKYKGHFKKNTAGNWDGTYQAWVDDVMIADYRSGGPNGGVYYSNEGTGLSDVAFVVIWGGMGGVVSGTHYLYMAGVYIGSADPGSSPPPAGKIPFPPRSITIQ